MMKTTVIAGVEVHIEESERYIQVNDAGAEDVCALWEQLKAGYNGYDVMFCYHNTAVPAEFLEKTGAVIADDCVEMRATVAEPVDSAACGITRVIDADFDLFAKYHDKCNPYMYWTSARIREDFDEWCIFVSRENGCITGYVLLAMWDSKQAEVFCVDAADNARCQALLSAAVGFALEQGRAEALFMADRDSDEVAAALTVGFSVTGEYKGYRVRV